MNRLSDAFGRAIDYVRVSVTDRCNMRCVYCLPEHWAPGNSNAPLPDEAVLRIVTQLAALGVTKIRLTGGEPLLRPGLADLVRGLSLVPGILDISLSTNGVLLAPLADELARAGLQRVNISLDSLRPTVFHDITRFGRLEDVLAGLESALVAGLSPVKVNVVVARGHNDSEIADFAALTQERPLHVRFIELMPMGETGFFSQQRWVPLAEMMEKAGPLEPLLQDNAPKGWGPARYYRRPGARGSIGFISALSCGFCDSCNRMRLTASGRLLPCLDDSQGVDLTPGLAESDAGLQSLIRQAVALKPEHHHMLERAQGRGANPRLMCQVGG